MSGNSHPSVIRDVILSNLNIESRAQCIVQISRQLLPGNLEAFHARAALDASREAPGLRDFHDVGGPVYTAMHYFASTAQERRSIRNELAVFRELVRVFNKKRGICVKLVQLDKLSIAEQFEVYASAKIVIGQHGAGLAYTAVMPNGTQDLSTLIEFDPNYNKNFYYTAKAVGVAYIHADRSKYDGIYNTADNTFVDLNPRYVARLVGSLLSDWAPPESSMKGVVYNGTAADPSPGAVLESRLASDIAFGKLHS
jgi:capsular polysaccharide biosynthesis protein